MLDNISDYLDTQKSCIKTFKIVSLHLPIFCKCVLAMYVGSVGDVLLSSCNKNYISV